MRQKVTPAQSTKDRNRTLKLDTAKQADRERSLRSTATPDMVAATVGDDTPHEYRSAASRERPEETWSRAMAAAIATVPRSWGTDAVEDAAMHAWRCVMDDAARRAGRTVGDVIRGTDRREANASPDAAMVWPERKRASYTVLRWRVLDWLKAESWHRDQLAGAHDDDDDGGDETSLDMVAATLGDDDWQNPQPARRMTPARAGVTATDLAGMAGHAPRSPVWTLFYATLRDEDAATVAGELQTTPETVWQHFSRARKALGADREGDELRDAARRVWQALTDEAKLGKAARKGHAKDGHGYDARRAWERRSRVRHEPARRTVEPTAERYSENERERRAHRMHPDRRTEARIRRAHAIARGYDFTADLEQRPHGALAGARSYVVAHTSNGPADFTPRDWQPLASPHPAHLTTDEQGRTLHHHDDRTTTEPDTWPTWTTTPDPTREDTHR